MKRRLEDRHGQMVPNTKQGKCGAHGGWRSKDAKLARKPPRRSLIGGGSA